MRNNIKSITYSGVLIAIGVILPQLFHIFGNISGTVFLPIHIAVLIAGFVVGPYYATIIGLLVTLLSAIFTGMPAFPIAYFIVFEMMGYGFFTGFCFKNLKLNKYISLIVGMIMGRFVYIIAVVFATFVLQLQFPFLSSAVVIDKFVISIPGIIVQLVTIPVILVAFEKGGLIDAKQTAN